MATTTRSLSLVFLDSNSERYTQSWRNVKAAPTSAEVKTFAQAIITNGAVFQKSPMSIGEASMTTTTVTPIDISD